MEQFVKDREAVLTRAASAGVTAVIDIGTDLASSKAAAGLSRIFDNVFASAGIHPHESGAAGDDDLAALEALLTMPRTVALGEIGLDYHYDFSPRETQQSLFKRQLQLARSLDMPVIIHVREAMQEALAIIDSLGAAPWRGVFHCFSGTAADAAEVQERGFHVSFTGVVTFKNFVTSDAVRLIQEERLLLETDCPYMAPVPHRGKRCEPMHLPHTGGKVAEIRGVSPEHLAAATTENAIALFGLELS